MTPEEIKQIPEDSEIVMSCLDNSPKADIIRVDTHGAVVQVHEKNGFILLLRPEHLVKGADGIIRAIDFQEEMKIPHGEEMPAFVKRAIAKFGEMDGSKTVHTRIGHNVSQFRVDSKNKEKAQPFNGHLADEIVRKIKIHTDDCDGIQTAIMVTPQRELGIAFLTVAPYHVFQSIKAMLSANEFEEIAFTIPEVNDTLDESVRVPNCTIFQKIYLKLKNSWWYGILPVQNVDGKPVYGEPDWANDTWTERMEFDIARADMIEKFIHYGTAMDGKINITKYVETDSGWFYEGNINQSKLDQKIIDFLAKNNLTVNDRKQVNEILLAHGKGIKMQKDEFGFITVRAGSFFATERRSKTRAYLEALENVIPTITT